MKFRFTGVEGVDLAAGSLTPALREWVMDGSPALSRRAWDSPCSTRGFLDRVKLSNNETYLPTPK